MDEENDPSPVEGEEGAQPQDAQEQPEPEQPGEQPVSVEDLASEMGHLPLDKWRGDPDKWKPAHEFLRHTVDINRSLAGRIKGLEDQIGNMARTSAVVAEQAAAAAREKALAERQEAFEIGDNAAFEAADRKLQTIRLPEPAEHPAVASFRERNAWFERDLDATAWCINRGDELARAGIGPERQIAIVEREAKDLFPDLFPASEEKPKPKPADLNKPGNRGGAPQPKKGFSSLPADAQAAAVDYERRGVCNRDEYAKIYYEQEA